MLPRVAIITGIKKAEAQCPICDGELRNKGYYWECKVCHFRTGRKWRSDPHGHTIDGLRYVAEIRERRKRWFQEHASNK